MSFNNLIFGTAAIADVASVLVMILGVLSSKERDSRTACSIVLMILVLNLAALFC